MNSCSRLLLEPATLPALVRSPFLSQMEKAERAPQDTIPSLVSSCVQFLYNWGTTSLAGMRGSVTTFLYA
jgi:hypothetical protein